MKTNEAKLRDLVQAIPFDELVAILVEWRKADAELQNQAIEENVSYDKFAYNRLWYAFDEALATLLDL